MGYGAASVRDIVRRTDLASGTFYNYFKDKDEIFEAVVGELTGELLKRHRDGPRPRRRTAEEFFRRHYAVYFEFVVEDAELLALARKNFTAIRTLFDKPDVRALALALNEDIRAAIAQRASCPMSTCPTSPPRWQASPSRSRWSWSRATRSIPPAPPNSPPA